jgi:hypothetical protein
VQEISQGISSASNILSTYNTITGQNLDVFNALLADEKSRKVDKAPNSAIREIQNLAGTLLKSKQQGDSLLSHLLSTSQSLDKTLDLAQTALTANQGFSLPALLVQQVTKKK